MVKNVKNVVNKFRDKKLKEEKAVKKITENKQLGVVNCKITRNETNFTSHKNVNKKWIVVDATNVVVGRLGAFLVNRLKGKHLASYTPNTDDGDKIVVINCDKVKFTGNKETDKIYYRHSDYVGGLKKRTAREIRDGKRPCDIVRTTVKRMLGRSRLNYKLVSKNLFLYAGSEHNQKAQNPLVVDFGSFNKKNVVG